MPPTPPTTTTDTDTENGLQGAEIRETHVVETPRGPERSVTVSAEADVTREYVGATDAVYRPWMDDRYVRQLPNPIDELMRDFGSRLYDVDMLTDPQVYSTLSILVMAILAQDLKLTSPVEQGDPDFSAAETVREFCRYNLDNLRHPLPEVLYELTEGMLKMGHKVAELVYDQRDWSLGEVRIRAATILVDMKTKAHEATAFVTDGYNNVLGLLYVKPGQHFPRLGPYSGLTAADILGRRRVGGEVGGEDEEGDPILQPRSKFCIPVHKPRNGDPRGTSHLRSVYTPYWKKQQLNPQHLAYVTRFAQPSVWGKIGKDAKNVPVFQAGVIVGYKSIVAQTNEALVKIKGGAVGSGVDTDVDLLEAASDGKVIFDSYAHEDRQIAKGILMQTLTTEEAQHMARAASAVHQDVFGLLVSYLRNLLEWAVRFDILQKLVRYNFGEEAAARLTPVVSLGDTDVQDIPKLMGGISQMALAGVLHESQYPGISSKLSLPPANEEERQRDRDLAREQREAAAKAAQRAAEAPAAPASPAARPGGPPPPGRAPASRPPARASTGEETRDRLREDARQRVMDGRYEEEYAGDDG